MADRTRVVLRVREALERRAKAEAARAEADLRAHVERTRALARAHDARPPVAGQLSPLQLRALQLQGMASWSQLAGATAAADEARAVRDERVAHRQRRTIDRRATERMVERRSQEAAAVAAATAQRALDDIAVARWGRR